ncbi:MAG TPA: asparagine synthase (glutamine-hydrolyzing) [Rhodanobacteraceae bacterium]|nr:asparagine synthase (glutamine-hydrolyzing) [Rhodanobacteraceae bacterium]
MCGIAGFWDVAGRLDGDRGTAAIDAMTCAIRHRGPDDAGAWRDPRTGLWLGHRRLSVVDLSPEGHQPMMSAGHRHVMVFNGEVYNHRQLRAELLASGVQFRGHSDTEVMLAAIERWGLEDAVARFIGMFALALWDREARTLTLVRDRLGIKPLYYGWAGQMFAFGSELKALAALPGFAARVDRGALCLLLRHSYIPQPCSIYQGIFKLPPGALLRVDAAAAASATAVAVLPGRVQRYWSVADAAAGDRTTQSDADAVEALDRLLRDAIALRMEADVPLGAFLSGGVDSSTVVALMQAQSTRPVETFSIGFHEQAHDEARYAREVAHHLGTAHHELYVSARDALDVIPMLPTMFDEPFSDSSQIPTFLVSQLARGRVTVSLSGDGGDELFAGYSRYAWALRLGRWLDAVPRPLRAHIAGSLRARPGLYEALFRGANRALPPRLRLRNPGTKAGLLGHMLGADSVDARYLLLVSHWFDPAALVLHAQEPQTPLSDFARWPDLREPMERMTYSDLIGYLPDDILVKVDRASMAVSLEARVPLLDHRVVEYAWRTPLRQKLRDGQGKWLLRQVLYRYVPQRLIDRPKKGFSVPIESWLRGPLRDWAEALLDERRLREQGYFDPAPIRRMWADHLAGRVREHHRLWDVLMFQAWLAERRVA